MGGGAHLKGRMFEALPGFGELKRVRELLKLYQLASVIWFTELHFTPNFQKHSTMMEGQKARAPGPCHPW